VEKSAPGSESNEHRKVSAFPVVDRRRLITAGAAFALVATSDRQASAADLAAYPTVTGSWGAKVSTEDYVEIQQLYAHYCHALDTGNPEAVARCWTKDGEMTRGYGPGQATADRTPTKGYSMGYAMGGVGGGGTRHMCTNLVITKTPEGAKGSVYLLLYASTTTPPSFVEVAIMDDTLVKSSEGWKFKKRVVWRDDDDISPFRPKQGGGPPPASPNTPVTPKTG
jgi:hypothetical protein